MFFNIEKNILKYLANKKNIFVRRYFIDINYQSYQNPCILKDYKNQVFQKNYLNFKIITKTLFWPIIKALTLFKTMSNKYFTLFQRSFKSQ